MDVASVPTTAATTGTATAEAEDHPGRWVGGVIGALASLLVGGVATLIGGSGGWAGDQTLLLIGLLGMPVGFVLGRAAMPSARGEGWWAAIGIGLLIAFAAPPLGAIELVLGGGVLGDVSGFGGCDVPPVLAASFLLMYAVPFSFIALVLTIPAGILWGLTVRLVPETWLRRARMPRPIAAFGVRHLVALVAIAVVLAGVVQIAAASGCRP
jgi:hypothetical protein